MEFCFGFDFSNVCAAKWGLKVPLLVASVLWTRAIQIWRCIWRLFHISLTLCPSNQVFRNFNALIIARWTALRWKKWGLERQDMQSSFCFINWLIIKIFTDSLRKFNAFPPNETIIIEAIKFVCFQCLVGEYFST